MWLSSGAQDCNGTWKDLQGSNNNTEEHFITSLLIFAFINLLQQKRCLLTDGVHLQDSFFCLKHTTNHYWCLHWSPGAIWVSILMFLTFCGMMAWWFSTMMRLMWWAQSFFSSTVLAWNIKRQKHGVNSDPLRLKYVGWRVEVDSPGRCEAVWGFCNAWRWNSGSLWRFRWASVWSTETKRQN